MRPLILMYHGVGRGDDPYGVEPATLAAHLDALREAGRAIVPLAALLEPRVEPNAVTLTFDDGTADFQTHAWPLLAQRALPVTLFIVTGKPGGRADWRPDGPPLLDATDWRALAAAGVSLGSHTHDHVDLAAATPTEARRQIETSYRILREMGVTQPAFSYPWGRLTSSVKARVQAVGYACAVGTDERFWLPGDDRFAMNRLAVTRAMDAAGLLAAIARASRPPGAAAWGMAWVRHLRNRLRQRPP